MNFDIGGTGGLDVIQADQAVGHAGRQSGPGSPLQSESQRPWL
jgi:hypothetical protein